MIMVGPGTGIAPFRGFLHDRLASGAKGQNWLFFGEQHAATDFYYRAELWRWLEDGASFYVCGDASRMAKDVDAALRSIVAEHGKMGYGAAVDYVSYLWEAKRYVRDVY